MAGGPIGGHGPNRVIEFARGPLPYADGIASKPVCTFVSNTFGPQLADYALVAGLGFFCASVVAPPPARAATRTVIAAPQFDPSVNQSRVWSSAVTPQGQANAAEYTFGTHALAIHQAEAVKSSVWGSVRTPPAVASTNPLRSIWASPEQVDLSISGWVAGGSQANQGPVPPLISTTQADPTQGIAQVWKSQPTAIAITPNPIATFFSIPPQSEDRQTRAVWQSLRAGQTPPVITSFYAAPQQIDLTQQGVIIASARTPPAVGPVPPLRSGAPQADPSQIAAQVWSSVQTPPTITGVTVWPALVVPAQFDTSINPTVLWTTSTFSPGLTPPITPAPAILDSGVRHHRPLIIRAKDFEKREDLAAFLKAQLKLRTPTAAEEIPATAAVLDASDIPGVPILSEAEADKLLLDEKRRTTAINNQLIAIILASLDDQ